MPVTVTVNHIPAMQRLLAAGMQQACNAVAARIRDEAKALVPSMERPGPFATSALKASIHVVTPHRSDYGEAISAAREVRTSAPDDITNRGKPRNEVAVNFAPPVDIPQSDHAAQAWVVAPTHYAFFVELGGFNESVLPGRAEGPFMEPAARKMWPSFVRDCFQVLNRLEALEAVRIEGEKQDAYVAAELSRARTEARQGQQAMFADYKAAYGAPRRQSGGRNRGYTRSGRQRSGKSTESFGEMWERVESEFSEWKSGRNSGGGV